MLYNYKKYITIVMILCSFLMVSTASATEIITVPVSQSRVMNFYAVQKVAIANPDIADVVVISSSEVLLVGKSPGVTSLHIWSADKQESFQVEVGADDAPIANEIKNIIGLNDLKVSKIGKTVILEGKINSQYQKNRAEKVAGAYGEKVVNLLEMTKPIQVKIETVIIEIDREKTKDLGVKWGSFMDTFVQGSFGYGQDITNSFLQGNVLGGLGKYSPVRGILTAMVKDGNAKILSQPNMITLSGEKANILVGGQIPVPISNQNGQVTIEWKDYGIKLDVEPEVSAEGLINSRIKAEVSSIDWNSTHKIQVGANTYIPTIKTNKAETVIALPSGQTMAIGGLLSSQTNRDITKVPFLADIPILGKLFTSNSYSRGETELIILVTPTLIDPAEYLPRVTPEMKEFLQEDPLGGNKDGTKNKDSNR